MKKGPFKMKNPIKIGRKIRQGRETALQSDNYKPRSRRARKGLGATVKGFFGL